jgi:hypothetical protein
MNAQDAAEILANGGRVKRASWPEFLFLEPGDKIPDDDLSAKDFIELTLEEWEALQAEGNTTLEIAQEQTLQQPTIAEPPIAAPNQQPPQTLTIGNEMPVLNVKKTKPLDIKGFFDGANAEVVLVLSAKCSDPTAALPILGDTPKVIGLKPATGLTIECEAVIKDKDGLGYEVGAISNTFDVVAVAGAEMVAALNADGGPMYETNDDGTFVLANDGNQKPLMIPSEAALIIKVQA